MITIDWHDDGSCWLSLKNKVQLKVCPGKSTNNCVYSCSTMGRKSFLEGV